MTANAIMPSSLPAGRHPCTHEGDISVLNAAVLEIKDTLRDLKDVLASNAVLEQQAISTRKTLIAMDMRLRELEIGGALHKGRGLLSERLLWALFTAALAGWTFTKGS